MNNKLRQQTGFILLGFSRILPIHSRLRRLFFILTGSLLVTTVACDDIFQPMCYDPAEPQDSIPNDTVPQNDTIIHEIRLPENDNTSANYEERKDTAASHLL